MSNKSTQKRKKIGFLVCLLAVFVIPIFVATYVYRNHTYFHFKTDNYGKILKPAKQVSDYAFADLRGRKVTLASMKGSWLVIFARDNCCLENRCTQRLRKLNQLHKALGKDIDRVKVLLSLPQTCKKDKVKRALAKPSNVIGIFIAKKHYFYPGYYIVDPHGNLVITYGRFANMSGLLKDLKKLLKVSQIG